MNARIRSRSGERGIALVMALLVLLVISIVGALLMASLQSETKMSSHDLRQASALNIAEAGVGEAVAKIRDDRFPDTPMNPRQVAQVFLTAPGTVPVLGVDSIALATSQPAGQWLPYSNARRDTNVLTIRWKTNAARDSVYRYDTTKDPPVNLLTGWPIYQITSTCVKGGDQRRVMTEVIRKPIAINIKGALTANNSIKFGGNVVVCGYNHSGDTPSTFQAGGKRVGEAGRGNAPDCLPYETVGGNLPSAWTTGSVINGGGAQQFAPNVPPWVDAQTGFYTGPWDAFNMGQVDFWSWLGPNVTVEPDPPMGVVHLDNNSSRMDQSGDFAYHGTTGEGLLYVDGNLSLNSSFAYTGLVYVEGDLKVNGQAWILGALIVRGKSTVDLSTGGCTVLYSSEAIQRVLSKYGGQFVTLSWRESNR
jgi:hypothetical protein